MSIAIMSEAGGLKSPGSGPAKETSSRSTKKPWGAARLGQSVLIVELIAQVQSMRRARDNPSVSRNLVFKCQWLPNADLFIELDIR